ncbi:CHAT domain-containing protein [Leptothermofonsia sp. ETS-13]|uniref:CHAT domain-containing protein n=1 Tax=Leptothermofonsia sp. ETS-13 TaxID=3035696 RepID=UPI003BA0DD5D
MLYRAGLIFLAICSSGDWLLLLPASSAPAIAAQAQTVAEKPLTDSIQPAPKTAANQLLQQGIEQYQTGQLETAVKSWQQALVLFRQAQDQAGEGMVLANLGAVYIRLERYREAIPLLESYLPIAQSLNDKQGEAQALGNLGIAYEALGNYGSAIATQKQAGKLMLALGDRRSLGQVLLNLGNTFEAVGDYDNAKAAYQQSLKIARKMGDRIGEGIALGNLGAVYANLGQTKEAIAAHEQSLKLARAIPNPSSEASALINLGSTYHSLGNQTQALSYYQQALKVAQMAQDHRREGEALGGLGLIYEDQKQYPQAIDFFQKSLAIARTTGSPEAQAIALNNLGHALFSAGRLAEAESSVEAAIQLLDTLGRGLNDTYQVSIFDTRIHTDNLLQQIRVAANKPEAALEAAERGRAWAFVRLLLRRSQKDNPDIEVKPFTIAQIKQIARQQNATLVEYAIVPDDDFKFRGKQRGRESELFIWVVQPNGRVDFRRVDLKPLWQKNATLTEVVQVARCLVPGEDCGPVAQAIRGIGIVAPESSQTDNAPAPPEKPRIRKQAGLRKLHDLLIAPIADLLPQDANARIIFIPQETLFLVPFAALQNPNGNYLIENHTILTAPSIQVLELTRKGREERSGKMPPASALIVGNPTMPSVTLEAGKPPQPLAPLPGAEQEALKIAELLQTKALIGNQATKAAVNQQLPDARVIHLATHGLLEYGNQNSYVSLQGLGVPGAIALAPSPEDNGLLTADEILNFHLNAELVVLSACNTGQGRITGDGVIGLSRAFISAGVPSVVVSLWAVPDAPTAQLMTAFYQNLQKNPDKAIALRQAMLDTMRTYPRPLDWAAFTLIGEAK